MQGDSPGDTVFSKMAISCMAMSEVIFALFSSFYFTLLSVSFCTSLRSWARGLVGVGLYV